MVNQQRNAQNKIYDDLPVQNLYDIFEEFYKYDRTVTKDMNEEEGICAITRLVTIIEQFFRGVMRAAFDNKKAMIPDSKLYPGDIIRKKQSDLLLPTENNTKNYLASMLYKFQQIDIIKKEMDNLGIQYCDPLDKKVISNLFALRHNITHTVAARPPYYEGIKNYYNVVETMFQTVLDGLDIPKWSFYRVKEHALIFLEDYEYAFECHNLAFHYLEKRFDTVDACIEMAFAYLDIDDIESAKRFVNMALDIDVNNADANYCKGIVLQIEEDQENADQFFQKAVKNDTYHVEAYIERIKYLHATKRVEECIEILDEAIKLMPSIPEFYYEQGKLRESNKMSDAQTYFIEGDNLIIKFVKLHSNNITKYEFMADVLAEYKRGSALHKCRNINA